MNNGIKDREYDKFREAENNLSKVAVTIEQDDTSPVPVFFGRAGEELCLYFESIMVSSMASSIIINYNIPVGKKVINTKIQFYGENRVKLLLEKNASSIYQSRTYYTNLKDIVDLSDCDMIEGDNLKMTIENVGTTPANFFATLTGRLLDA